MQSPFFEFTHLDSEGGTEVCGTVDTSLNLVKILKNTNDLEVMLTVT
jgi:hypothetical protein